jgi:DNA-binding GntR family transcriptional regulator
LSQIAGRGHAVTAHSYALSAMRDAILNGTLPAGTRLLQSELASQLEVSITPVREALRDLAAEGLVVLDAHRGSYVRRLDVSEVRELYELRITLEPLMVRRVVPTITTRELNLVDSIRKKMEKTKDIGAWAELNRQFHASLFQSDEPSRLAGILSSLRDSASPYVRLSLGADTFRATDSNVEHARLVQLYRDRDVEGAVALTVQHLKTTLATIESVYEDETA